MLTLIGLMRVFHGAFLEQAPNRQALLSGTGSALWASAVGLVARHIVFSLDQTERSRTPLFKGLMDELREQATAFRQAQFRLLKLVNDFAEKRESLLTREQQAVQLYVERLEAGTAALGAIAREYPDAVTKLAAKIGAATETVKETTAATKEALEQMRATLEMKLQEQANESSKAMRTATESVAKTRETLELDLLAIRTQLSALADSVGGISRQAGQLVAEVGAVNASLRALPDELRTRMTSQDEAARQSLDANRKLLEQAAADMRQIDQVVTDLAKVLPEHLRELVAEP
jgi:chromosome segregation ATPase